jgi:hypothetical protein
MTKAGTDNDALTKRLVAAGRDHPLIGRCFITRQHGRTHYQGIVLGIVPSGQGDLALVQYFECMMDEPNAMELVPLAAMAGTGRSQQGYPEHDWVFFEDAKHLRHYMDNVQSRRDQRIDRKKDKQTGGQDDPPLPPADGGSHSLFGVA